MIGRHNDRFAMIPDIGSWIQLAILSSMILLLFIFVSGLSDCIWLIRTRIHLAKEKKHVFEAAFLFALQNYLSLSTYKNMHVVCSDGGMNKSEEGPVQHFFEVLAQHH